MNNQYEYVETPLTPGIARKLIVELFAGRTVQKQEIVRIVDETHLERGGMPPKAKRLHPVTMALSKMKREGQAKNPRQGHWFIFLTPQDDDNVDSERNNLDSENLDPEKTIGSGKQSVYLYYYPAYRHLAEIAR